MCWESLSSGGMSHTMTAVCSQRIRALAALVLSRCEGSQHARGCGDYLSSCPRTVITCQIAATLSMWGPWWDATKFGVLNSMPPTTRPRTLNPPPPPPPPGGWCLLAQVWRFASESPWGRIAVCLPASCIASTLLSISNQFRSIHQFSINYSIQSQSFLEQCKSHFKQSISIQSIHFDSTCGQEWGAAAWDPSGSDGLRRNNACWSSHRHRCSHFHIWGAADTAAAWQAPDCQAVQPLEACQVAGVCLPSTSSSLRSPEAI